MKVHILVFVVLVLGQTVAAQSTVHNVPCVSSQSVGLPTEAMMSAVPQWVKDRQQYETSYVYVPSAVSQPAEAMAAVVPQWVKDRQQYETSYVYVPSASIQQEQGCSAAQELRPEAP